MSWFSGKKIVVPVDFSKVSLQAVDVALDLVQDASLISVIHVLPSLTAGEPGLLWNVLDEANARQQAQAALERHLDGQRYSGVNLVVAFGNPADEIVELADSSGAELIVMPSHGRTGLSHLVLGSVAERVTRHAHCPVLILRD
jgi:nucleotide-binding universal stress UspA family protein